MIYLDNSATGWPRPDAVGAAMLAALDAPGNPGRGAYPDALASGRLLYETRLLAAELFGAAGPEQVVFTSGATLALNVAIAGLLAPGDHAVTTDLEHNAVLRPLYAAADRGVSLTIVPTDRGVVSPDDLAAALRPNTALVVLTHGSNVLGTVQPVDDVARVCAARGVPLVVDAAQTAGLLPLDLARTPVAAVACSGHKSLLGPPGTGLLVLRPGVRPRPLVLGGTGFDSHAHGMPADPPESLEPGTQNLPGIAGLGAALRPALAPGGPDAHHGVTMARARRLRAGLAGSDWFALPDIDLGAWRLPIVAGTVLDRAGRPVDSAEVADALATRAGIAARGGFHCAPLVHDAHGTAATGMIRFSPGPTTTDAEIDAALDALRALHEES